MCARQSLARENRRNRCRLETRVWSPAGESPAQPKPSRQVGSESCVVPGRPKPRSVDSELCGPCHWTSKGSHSGAEGSSFHAGSTDSPRYGKWKSARRGRRARQASDGLPRNLGAPTVSAPYGVGGCRSPSWPLGVATRAQRSEEEAQRGTVELRDNQGEAGRAVGSRSTPILPVKQGNRPEGPCGGKRGAGSWNC